MYKDIGCGEVRQKHAGKIFCFAGWVHKRRDHGSLIFIDLRDSKGIIQIVFDPRNSEDSHQIALSLRSEWVIEVEGTVQKRIKGAENPNLKTGEVEVIATRIRILNKSKTPPFEINEDINVDENLRLKYRYLDLRKPNMQKNIKIRHSVTKAIWDYLHDKDFIQIETPILIKSTPEGARDYVVPSRVHPGNFYALPQSPQQMKQILMVSGFERYFQIARCFRDEDLRADRQPEHTQLDFEMSFVEQDDVLNLVEDLYKSLVKKNFPKIKLPKKFPRISFKDAIDLYGTDKPDLRFDLKLVDLTSIFSNSEFGVFNKTLSSNGIIKGFVAPGCSSYSRSQISELNDLVIENGG
ncbi:MAG TPA: aspartate--tRNA ligase, partial [Dehalococcoidia bacterium]|nr:aspartate--tRNA ligase [Dehalococcoidia bacterium]